VGNEIYERANYQCELCGSTKGLQKHHIVKRSQGGKDTKANQILTCWDCHHGTNGIHGREGNKLDLQLKAGLEWYYRQLGVDNLRELMGGRLYMWDIEIPEFIMKHFRRLLDENT